MPPQVVIDALTELSVRHEGFKTRVKLEYDATQRLDEARAKVVHATFDLEAATAEREAAGNSVSEQIDAVKRLVEEVFKPEVGRPDGDPGQPVGPATMEPWSVTTTMHEPQEFRSESPAPAAKSPVEQPFPNPGLVAEVLSADRVVTTRLRTAASRGKFREAVGELSRQGLGRTLTHP